MTIQSKADFSGLYLTTSGQWPDQITGTITPERLRNGIQDLFDSQISNWYADTSGIIGADGSGLVGVDFNSNLSAPPWKEGRVFYDNVNKCFAVYNDASGVILQVGQETYVRIINQTTSSIPNATVVELVSAGNAFPSVQPALAASGTDNAPHVIGFTTHEIAAGAQGFVTINGLVNDIDTSPFSIGDILYLSTTTSGEITNVEPNAPYPAIHVGSVIVDHASAGRILTHIVPSRPIECSTNVNGTVPLNGYVLGYNIASGYWDSTNTLNAAGGFMFGDVAAGNYSEFQEDTGFMRGHGSGRAWDDLRFPFTGQRLDTAAGRVDYNFTDNTVDFQDNATAADEVNIIAQMQHDWAQDTDVHPHIHWIQNQDQDPAWRMDYRVYDNGGFVPSWTTGVAPSTARIFTYTSGNTLQLTEFPIISGATELSGFAVSWFMDVKIYRVATSDSYSGTASAKEFDLHYLRDDNGSRQKYIK